MAKRSGLGRKVEGYAPVRACGEAKLARDVLTVEVIVTAAVKGG